MQKAAYAPRETAFSLTLSSQPDTLRLIQMGNFAQHPGHFGERHHGGRMIVENKARAMLLAAALLAGAIGAGAAVASSAVANPRSTAQAGGQYVFACVNQNGKIDYLEFRNPLPHQCRYSDETLWHWAAVAPGPAPSPSASPTATPTPTPTPIPTVTVTVTVTVTATPTA
jgi:hypothetical protein